MAMETHYMKVAFRNLLKYKTQTLFSLFGLALAFACVSLAVYWNFYERTYDAFHSNADRIYRLYTTKFSAGKASGVIPIMMYERLKNEYPEVETACIFQPYSLSEATFDGITLPQTWLMKMTPEALEMFDVEWLEGDTNLQAWGKWKIAISDELAKRVYGRESPIGKRFVAKNIEDGEFEIVAVYKSWSKHSNFKPDMLGLYSVMSNWSLCPVYAMLKERVDHEHFIQKVGRDTLNVFGGWKIVSDVVVPLTAMHYTNDEGRLNVRLSDVGLFTGAAALLAVCALLNYLVLFVSRLRGRGRDMALRIVSGSSGWQINRLLMTEYLLLLLASFVLGMVFVELCINKFVELSLVEVERSAVLMACGALLLFIVVLAWLLSAVPIYYFKRKTLRVQIESAPARPGRNYFRMSGVCMQLVIGLLFMLCSMVMIKQVRFLLHDEVNIARTQTAWVYSETGSDRLMDILRQIPAVQEMVPVSEYLFPLSSFAASTVLRECDEKPIDAPQINCRVIAINDSIARFYGLQMKEGDGTFELGTKEIFINETLAGMLNMENPIGKSVGVYKVKGIIADFQSQSPTEPIPPIAFEHCGTECNWVAFKYSGSWKSCKQAVTEALVKAELLSSGDELTFELGDAEETYKEFVKSEYNLLKLLGAITAISVVIALFGIYALIVQSCEQHRKEIAIRKVNGARVKDILLMFFKQYMIQVLVAAAIAFPLGYVLMKYWLEGYNRQTEINFWLFVGIFAVTALLVTLCIGWHVWRAANENPARVIKKE